MLKKIIGFICEIDNPFTNENLYNGCGGSETWVIKLAYEFEKLNYHIIVFNKLDYHFLATPNIEYVQIDKLVDRLNFQHFDHIFIMRQYSQDIINILKEHCNCKNYYLVAHDLRLWKKTQDNNLQYFLDDSSNFLTYYDIENDEWNKSHIHKLFFMSDFHYEQNKEYFPQEFCNIIGNGIDITENNNDNRDNSILWSSCYERGIDILIDKIYPLVIKEIPDFKIYTACYNNNLPDKYNDLDYVINLGSLSKEDLYNEFQKHKVWFLPLCHWETFCISVLEAIINNANISIPFKFGIKTSLKYFESICLKDGEYTDDEYIQYVANDIIDKIKNYNKYAQLRSILYEYVKDNYSWNSIANKINNVLISYES